MDFIKDVKELFTRAEKEEIGLLAPELAEKLLLAANKDESYLEKKQYQELSRMMEDEKGKVFLTALTDQCFRSNLSKRVADQICYLIDKYGVPSYPDWYKRLGLRCFRSFGKLLPSFFVPLTKGFVRHETSKLILPGEREKLSRHMDHRRKEGVRINLNHLGEAILGEEEAKKRLNIYLDDLKNPSVEYISVKISTIYSQISLTAWEKTLTALSERFRELLRVARENRFKTHEGKEISKFVNLDMEEYRDLELTVELFMQVMSEPEFLDHSAGIVLQAYLPDSFGYQKKLTEWAVRRKKAGGAPVKIRIVKGANLAMEQVEGSIRGWPQAPFETKSDVDANFKKMVDYAFIPEHAQAVHIGVGSHNLFDISYALLLMHKNGIQGNISFEMLEGMADPLRRAVQSVVQEMLLYCPAARKEEFQNAVAYLVRRLDENTAPENFLRHAFGLKPDTPVWESEKKKYLEALQDKKLIETYARRTQNRSEGISKLSGCCRFTNEPDTDFSLAGNRGWIEEILKKAQAETVPSVPLVIGGKERGPAKATKEEVEIALNTAEIAFETFKTWPYTKRATLLRKIADNFRKIRGDLIQAMAMEASKTVQEADVEVSEAIDFAEYYAKNLENLHHLKDLEFEGVGPALVLPPWNFPCAIPAGGCLAALAAGCSVIFKPANETAYVAYQCAQAMWDAGVPREVLQFIRVDDEPEGSMLVEDPRIKAIILTGASATAKKLSTLQHGFELSAETGGKNAMYVSNISDRDLAIKDILQSAFNHAGQKCSALSNLILHEELYYDKHFKEQLKDAAQSLKVGLSFAGDTKVPPLIVPPSPHLHKALTTTEEGESWLLRPKKDKSHPHLYSPGIKWGVRPGSFSHMTEFFGPVLGVMSAKDVHEAIEIANKVPYGLTSGIHSLDDREIKIWEKGIVAGNLYVNRTTTGAIVGRQPFGGTKESQFGRGHKAGGPNYILQFMKAKEGKLPNEKEPFPHSLGGFHPQNPERFHASLDSYTFFWKHYFSKRFDTNKLVGQDNYFYYRPHDLVYLRVHPKDSLDDVMRVHFACRLTRTPLEISAESPMEKGWTKESDEKFLKRLKEGPRPRVRLLKAPSKEIEKGLKEMAANVHLGPVSSNGRIELLNYLREVSLSHDYHRYGNLGEREHEERALLPDSSNKCCTGGCR